MKKSNLLLLVVAISAVAFCLSASALELDRSVDAKAEETKSVAWYTANLKEARAKNKECYGDPKATELQATPNCVNSLQALKISFAGAK